MPLFQKKVIMKNKPTPNAKGQYNYGDVGMGLNLLGLERGDTISRAENELCTLSEGYDLDSKLVDGGKFFLSKGSRLEVESCYIKSRKINTYGSGEPDHYRNVQVAFYFLDGANHNNLASIGGEQIKEILGEDNSFGVGKHCIGYWNKGNSNEDEDLGDVIENGVWNTDGVAVKNFPAETIANHSTFNPSEINSDMEDFTKGMAINSPGGWSVNSYYLVVRVSGDQKEYSPLGHGFLGLGGGYKTDELDRTYFVCQIYKKDLFDVWRKSNGDSITIQFRDGWDTDPDADLVVDTFNKHDEYGDNRGHKSPGDWFNDYGRCYNVKNVKIKITAPIWSPNRAKLYNESIWWNEFDSENDKPFTEMFQYKNIDYTGWVDTSPYNLNSGTQKYFDTSQMISSSLISSNSDYGNFRSITSVSSSVDIVDEDFTGQDLQTYYIPKTMEHKLSAAPNNVSISVKLANQITSFDPIYSLYPGDYVKHKFFVDNWNWKEGDPETLEEIIDSMPKTGNQLDFKQIYENSYLLKDVFDTGNSEDSVVTNTYGTPGLKIIKLITFSMIYNSWEDVNGNTPYYIPNEMVYWQLLRADLSTITINLNPNTALVSDFSETGGIDYNFLPYPEPYRYGWPFGCEYDNGVFVGYENCDDIVRGSHPVISGLDENSDYVQSLRNIINMNAFDKNEQNQKYMAHSSLDNTPGEDFDEYGKYIGTSDISQVRYFRDGTIDLPTLLNIQTGVDFGEIDDTLTSYPNNFNPHTDKNYWDGNLNQFPQNTSVGDSYIYNYDSDLYDKCLVELNMGDLDGVTMYDSTGHANKGIIFGDYSLQKSEKNIPVIKNSTPKIPELETEDGAF
jgi:hypothetical protein